MIKTFEQFINENIKTYEAQDFLGFCYAPEYQLLVDYCKEKFSFIKFKKDGIYEDVDWTQIGVKKGQKIPENNEWFIKIQNYIDSLTTEKISWKQLSSLINFLSTGSEESQRTEKEIYNTLLKIPKNISIEEIKKIYIEQMMLRDLSSGTEKGDRIGQIFDSVVNNTNEPSVLLLYKGKLQMIGGRTRLFAALSLKKESKVIIMK